MIDPSESARRIASAFQRFGVPLDDKVTAKDANVFAVKRVMGTALPSFVDRMTEEIDAAEMSDNLARVLKLRLKQLGEASAHLLEAGAGDRFESDELAIIASLIDVTVGVFGAAVGKEFRAASP